jgi:ribosome-binding factor A
MVNRSFKRSDRIADVIQHELAILLHRHAKDPRFHAVTITAVDVSADLENANVLVSQLDESKIAETVSALNKAAGYLRRELAQTIDLRYMPKLHFRYDDSLLRADRINKLLNDSIEKK